MKRTTGIAALAAIAALAPPRKTRKPKRSAIVVYRGPSLLTGETVLAVAVPGSKNTKTGNMVSLHIVPAPETARAVRPHASVCPTDCAFRDAGGCYVNWAFAANSVQRAHHAKPMATLDETAGIGRGAMVRLGAEGDPAAVPAIYLRALISEARGWTGYTHAWRAPEARALSSFLMASVESVDAARMAWNRGWRTYRVKPDDDAPEVRGMEAPCPSSRGIQCADCGLCSGTLGKGKRGFTIAAHGGAVAKREARKIAEQLARWGGAS